MKGQTPIIRILGMRIWDATPLSRNIKLYGYRKLLRLGNKVSIHSHVMISAHHSLGGVKRLSVGADCVFNENVNIDITGNVSIGNRVLLAEGVLIYTHSHKRPNRPKEHTEATNLIIGDDVFIGARSIVLSTCHYIGSNSIIGAGAVVSRDIPDNSVAVGVPAKIIRTLAST